MSADREPTSAPPARRNLAAVSLTSFLTDLSSEMVLNLLPLYLAGPLGLKASVIGLIEGVAEGTASLLKVASGWLSDRLRARKWLAVAGYGLSALAKPFFYWTGSWGSVAAVRWLDRVGKGVRTAPRDALLADSVAGPRRGFSFGLHRAADTAGAALGLGVAMAVVWWLQGSGAETLSADTFRAVVLVSIVPGLLAVAVLALMARDVPIEPLDPSSARPAQVRGGLDLRGLGRPFLTFLAIAALFDLGNSADAFLVLRASERGLGVLAVLAMLLTMNLVYAATSTWFGALSDRIGRKSVLIAGWLLYAVTYLGLGLARDGAQVWALVAIYGLYHGLTQGTARAMVADLVPAARRGTAFGLFSAVLALLDVPASVIAGLLWQGIGPAAPFLFGAALAALAAAALALWRPPPRRDPGPPASL